MNKNNSKIVERQDLAKVLVVFLSIFFTGNHPSALAQDAGKTNNDHLFWEISGNKLSKPSYLFGTVHIYDTNVFKIPKQLFAKLKQCNSVVLELDFGQVNQMAIMKRMFIQSEDSTLDKLLKPEAYKKLLQLPFAQLMPEEQIKKFKPIMLTSMMLMDDFANTPSSVDQELYNYAVKEGKTIVGLETMEEQMDAVDAIPLNEQVGMLEKSLEEYSNPKEMLNRLLDAYKEQDFKHLEQEMENSAPSPLFSEKLVAERNLLMANRIDSLFAGNNKNRLFIGVGALHINSMDGIKGVVELLKEKGYILKPVDLKFE